MKRRILFAIVGVATFAVVIFGAPLAWAIRRIEHDDALAMLQREAARAAVDVPAIDDPGAIQLPDPQTKNVSVAVYRADGARIVGRGPDHADRATSAALQGRLAQYSDSGAIAVGWPLTNDETTIGAIRAAIPESTFEHKVHVAWGFMAVLGLLVIGITAFIARRHAGRLARPVDDLTAAVARLGDGDFYVDMPPSGITEVDKAGAALRATASRLRRLVTRERAFSSDVSHQLRTPLTGLRLSLENAASGTVASDVVFDEALESVDRLESTITDLLKLARSERPSVEPVLLLPLVEDVGRLWSRELSAQGRLLRVDVEPGLPPVPVTESALRQILDVLLANARDHGAGTVTVCVSHTIGGLVLEVADEGVGVAGDVERVFLRGEGTGHGIGLALARSLAEAEGARLTLAAPGPQPRFRLLVPVASAVTPAATSS